MSNPAPIYDNPAERAQREAEFAAVRERMRILHADMLRRREERRPKPPAPTPGTYIALATLTMPITFLN